MIFSKNIHSFIPPSVLTPFFQNDVRLNIENNTHLYDNSYDISFGSDNSISVDTLESEQSARFIFEKLYRKKETDNDTFNADLKSLNSDNDIDTSDFEKKFYQLAEKRIYKKAELDYQEFVEKRENKMRSHAKKLKELEEYNNELLNKTIEAKIKAADKKRAKRQFMRFWIGVLLGDDDDPSIPKPMLCVLQQQHSGFIKFLRFNAYRITSVQPISPITLGEFFQKMRIKYHGHIDVSIVKRPLKSYFSFYRQWIEQFVKRIIEKRQRGPPSFL